MNMQRNFITQQTDSLIYEQSQNQFVQYHPHLQQQRIGARDFQPMNSPSNNHDVKQTICSANTSPQQNETDTGPQTGLDAHNSVNLGTPSVSSVAQLKTPQTLPEKELGQPFLANNGNGLQANTLSESLSPSVYELPKAPPANMIQPRSSRSQPYSGFLSLRDLINNNADLRLVVTIYGQQKLAITECCYIMGFKQSTDYGMDTIAGEIPILFALVNQATTNTALQRSSNITAATGLPSI